VEDDHLLESAAMRFVALALVLLCSILSVASAAKGPQITNKYVRASICVCRVPKRRDRDRTQGLFRH
jgi:hypothetical protein